MPSSASTDLDQLDLDLVLDRHAEVPIGVQLAWALRARLSNGALTPGQRLPGLRDLATALHINANTVRAVYQRLEHEGILVSRQGSGTFVADALSQAPSAAGVIAAQAAQAALDTGVDPRDVAAALYVAPVAVAASTAPATTTPASTAPATTNAASTAPASTTAASTTARPAVAVPTTKSAASSTPGASLAARRRQLRAQIAALQRTLGELETRHPALVPLPAEPIGPAGPRLLDVGELEQVQARLVSRLTALHAAIDKLAARASGSTAASGRSRARQATKAPESQAPTKPPRRSARSRSPNAPASANASTPTSTRARPAPAGA
jgi:DNA-binding transcriptional regulator YhcF (GntR family)